MPEKTNDSITFFHDSEAQAESSAELADIPHIGLEELIFRHEGDLQSEFGITLGGQGIESTGFIVKGKDGKKAFFKIFKGVIPLEIMMDFIQKAGIRREDFMDNKDPEINRVEFNMYLSDLAGREASRIRLTQSRIANIQNKALAIKKGHQLLPNRVPQLQTILTWHGVTAGFSYDYIQGVPQHLDENNPEYAADIQLLRDNNIDTDSFIDANNAIREPNGNVKFIDLRYTGEV